MKIKNKNIIQVVNGAGAKPYLDGDDYVHPEYINDKRGCKLLHFNTELGYCMFDMKPKSLKIHYFDKNNNELFVSSAIKSLSKKEYKKFRYSGSLFSIKTNMKGKLSKSYKVNL